MRYLIIVIMVFAASCKEEIKAPEGSYEENLQLMYKERMETEWLNLGATDLRCAQQYGFQDGTIIWRGDLNKDEVVDYFIAEKDIEVHKGVRRALLVDEKGNRYLRFDRRSGVYTYDPDRDNKGSARGNERCILDFRSLGFQDDDIKCMRILFKNNRMGVSEEDINSSLKQGNVIRGGYSGYMYDISVQLIDKNLGNMSFGWRMNDLRFHKYDFYSIGLFSNVFKDRVFVFFALFTGQESLDGMMKILRSGAEWYYQMKRQGKQITVDN